MTGSGVAGTIAAQEIGVYGFRLVALLPVIGIGLACLGEASDNAVVRRQSILALGCILAVFAFETSAWGLLFKNLFSDAGASAYNMIRYRDPPPWAPFSRGQPVRNDVVKGERQASTEFVGGNAVVAQCRSGQRIDLALAGKVSTSKRGAGAAVRREGTSGCFD